MFLLNFYYYLLTIQLFISPYTVKKVRATISTYIKDITNFYVGMYKNAECLTV
jgi:hypothetical protein